MHSATRPDSSTAQPSTQILQSPWTQAIVTGALTLIPARSYPRWLRGGLIWSSALIGGIAGGYFMVAQRESSPGQQTGSSIALPLAVGVGIGTTLSGLTAAGFWADEKLDRGLRRLKVPYPRVIMGIGAGAITWLLQTKEQQDGADN